MRKKKNYKLSKNFSLYEYLEGIAMPKEGIEMAWEYFTDEHEELIKEFIPNLEAVRTWANNKFREENDNIEIGVRITCGFRPYRWEILKGRKGTSQHTIVSVDFDLLRCHSKEFEVRVLAAIHKEWNKFWRGGLAIKHPTKDSKGKIIKTGFIHLDPRSRRTRWTY